MLGEREAVNRMRFGCVHGHKNVNVRVGRHAAQVCEACSMCTSCIFIAKTRVTAQVDDNTCLTL